MWESRFIPFHSIPPSPPLQFVEVSFAYDNGHVIYEKIDFGVDLDSRIALVGPNGAGKSTLLKLMTGELQSTDGAVKRHNHLRIGQYHQVRGGYGNSAPAFMLRAGCSSLVWPQLLVRQRLKHNT